MVDRVLPIMDGSDSAPADPGGGRGGGSSGDGSLRDVIDQIYAVSCQMAASSEAAKLKIPQTDENKEACASLAGRLSGVLKTLTDANATLSTELTQIPSEQVTHRKDGDRKGFRWLYNVNDRRAAGVSESSDETDKAAQQSKAVSTGDGKRSRVGTSQAAAAVAASSGGASVSGRGASPKGYGRPCLPGLPEGVIGHLGSFMSTIAAASRLTKINKETRQKAIDETFGAFRHFSMTKDEEAKYQAIRKLREVKHLGKIRAAYVEASGVVQCVVELLERSAETLKELHVADDNLRGEHPLAQRRPPGDPFPFPKLTDIQMKSPKWLGHISSVRRWCLPALKSLRVGRLSQYNGSSESLTRLIKASPNIERLESEMMGFDDTQWADFTAALGRCPHIKAIIGLHIEMDQLGRLNQLKQALNQHWAKTERRDVPKSLGFVVFDPNIGADCRQRAAGLEGISKWAAEVSCRLEWRLWRWLDPSGGVITRLRVDCSSDAGTAHPAPGGLYGEIVKQLAAEATQVWLRLGGTPIHPSWRDKLVFTNATSLWLHTRGGPSTSDVVDSIPAWLAERDGAGQTAMSRSFPAVELLDVSVADLSFSDLPSPTSKLSRLVGGLAGLERVFFRDLSSASMACELLSYLSVPRLSEVEIAAPLSREWPASVPAEWSFRSPRIERLASAPPEFVIDQWHNKEDAQLFLQLVATLRPARVDFTATLDRDDLEGEGEGEQGDNASGLHAARSFAWECYVRVKALYTMTGGSCEQIDVGEYRLAMQLAAK